jgi:hypothetical protein
MINPIEMAKDWLIGIALKKVMVRVVALIVSYVTAKAAVVAGTGLNVAVDPDKLTVAIYGGFEFVRNWAKMKFPKVFGWL